MTPLCYGQRDHRKWVGWWSNDGANGALVHLQPLLTSCELILVFGEVA